MKPKVVSLTPITADIFCSTGLSLLGFLVLVILFL